MEGCKFRVVDHDISHGGGGPQDRLDPPITLLTDAFANLLIPALFPARDEQGDVDGRLTTDDARIS